LKIDRAMRSPSKLSTSSENTSTICWSYSIIEPDTSRHSTMSRVASFPWLVVTSTGRAARNPAATATSAMVATPAHWSAR